MHDVDTAIRTKSNICCPEHLTGIQLADETSVAASAKDAHQLSGLIEDRDASGLLAIFAFRHINLTGRVDTTAVWSGDATQMPVRARPDALAILSPDIRFEEGGAGAEPDVSVCVYIKEACSDPFARNLREYSPSFAVYNLHKGTTHVTVECTVRTHAQVVRPASQTVFCFDLAFQLSSQTQNRKIAALFTAVA